MDHISPALTVSPVVTLSKNGSSFSASTGTIQEIGNGWYKLTPASLDFNTLGPLVLHAEAVGADPTDAIFEVNSGVVELSLTQVNQLTSAIQKQILDAISAALCNKFC